MHYPVLIETGTETAAFGVVDVEDLFFDDAVERRAGRA